MLEKFNTDIEIRLNIKYGIAQGFYWMLYCCILGMASAFLLGRGFSTAAVGFLLGFIFIIAVFIQQAVSSYADNSSKVSVLDILLVMSSIQFLGIIGLCASRNSHFATGFWFILLGTLLTVMLPLLNSLNFALMKTGYKVNFGACRAVGSLFYFVMSLLAGALMNSISPNAAPVLALIVSILYAGNFIWLKIDVKDFDITQSSTFDPVSGNDESNIFSVEAIKQLYKKYQMFFVFLAGVVGFYFGHVLINNFFYQIVVNAGGNTADTGKVLALQAIVELPAMIFFGRIMEVISTKKLLGISAIFYLIKIFFTTIATSVGMIYFSVLFQALAFAIFIPASVHLVDEIMSKKDAVKGQAFVTISMTLANFLSAIFGGLLINYAGVTPALVIGTIITLVGVVVAIFGLVRIK